MTKRWIPLESNPEVMTDYAAKLGLDPSKCTFSDVFGLDEELLAMVPQPVLAVILCFPITEDIERAAKQEDEEQASKAVQGMSDVYFMKQTIGNACGTIAVLHSIANNLPETAPADGSFLSHFLSATQGLSPEQRGAYLEDPPAGAPSIEEAHQAAAAGGDSAPPADDEEVDLHFVAFVHRAGQLWQLDGRRRAPVHHGATSPDTLLADAAKVVQQFMEKTNSISFNVLALTAAA